MAGQAEIGVIGGSGFYTFLDDATEVVAETPFGPPSDPIVVGEVAGRKVAFVPRHGRDHRFPPHRIPYRANLWALRALGVRQVLAPSAVGSLTASYGPGTLAVPDQVVDRTRSRPSTPSSRTDTTRPPGSGTLVVIEGPRFSSRAESQWFAAQGWTLIGMTGLPEAALARELALCYTTIALVTDTDAGVEEGEGVTHAEVFRVFGENVDRLRGVVAAAIERLPAERNCPCPASLDGIELPLSLP